MGHDLHGGGVLGQKPRQLSELMVIAVAVHQDLKIGIPALGLARLDVNQVEVFFLRADAKVLQLKTAAASDKGGLYLESAESLDQTAHFVLEGEEDGGADWRAAAPRSRGHLRIVRRRRQKNGDPSAPLPISSRRQEPKPGCSQPAKTFFNVERSGGQRV